MLVPPAEVTADAEYVEVEMTNGLGVTAAVADLEAPSVLVGVFGGGCEAGAAAGVVLAVDFTDCTTVEVTPVTVEAGVTLAVAEKDFDCSVSAECAESMNDVEVSVTVRKVATFIPSTPQASGASEQSMRAASLVFMVLAIVIWQVSLLSCHNKPPGSSEGAVVTSKYVKPVLLKGMTALPVEQTDCPAGFTVGRTPSQV